MSDLVFSRRKRVPVHAHDGAEGLMALLDGQTGGQVAQRTRWWAEHHADALDAPGREAIRTACRYLADRTRTRLMKYADALHDGLPIATGVIEGASRYLVKDRMDRTARAGPFGAPRPSFACAPS